MIFKNTVNKTVNADIIRIYGFILVLFELIQLHSDEYEYMKERICMDQ